MEFRNEIAHRIQKLEMELKKREDYLKVHLSEKENATIMFSYAEEAMYIKDEIEELKTIFWNMSFVKFV